MALIVAEPGGTKSRCAIRFDLRWRNLADAPAGGELAWIEVHDFHLGPPPNDLAGVHEGAVPPSSQGNS